MKREIGDIFNWKSQGIRKTIKTDDGFELYAVFVAKNNPDICGEWFEGCEVHHKDGNPSNDVPENLICLTPQEHHSAHIKLGNHPCRPKREKEQKCSNGNACNKKAVTVLYEGENCGTFASIQEVTEAFDIPRCVIQHYLKKQTPLCPKWKDYSFIS